MAKRRGKVIKFPSGRRPRSRKEERAIAAYYARQERQQRRLHGMEKKPKKQTLQDRQGRSIERQVDEFMKEAGRILSEKKRKRKVARLGPTEKGVLHPNFLSEQMMRGYEREQRRPKLEPVHLPDPPIGDTARFIHKQGGFLKGKKREADGKPYLRGKRSKRAKVVYAKRILEGQATAHNGKLINKPSRFKRKRKK
ncbi:MAG: hypothetical protein ACW99J_15275 [Candidatus Thorarchaeota archaeon]|jgi:hypothetical protein